MQPLAQATHRLTGNLRTPTPILAALVAAGLGPEPVAYAATDLIKEDQSTRWSIWAVDNGWLHQGHGNAPTAGGEIADAYVRSIRLSDLTMVEVGKVWVIDGFDGPTAYPEITFVDRLGRGFVINTNDAANAGQRRALIEVVGAVQSALHP